MENLASVAGYVLKVGSEVTRFKKGDRVLSNSASMLRNSPRYGVYQRFTLSSQELTSHVSNLLTKSHASPPETSRNDWILWLTFK